MQSQVTADRQLIPLLSPNPGRNQLPVAQFGYDIELVSS
jgi:hypothetical protein